jgi:hypothetical protein
MMKSVVAKKKEVGKSAKLTWGPTLARSALEKVVSFVQVQNVIIHSYGYNTQYHVDFCIQTFISSRGN